MVFKARAAHKRPQMPSPKGKKAIRSNYGRASTPFLAKDGRRPILACVVIYLVDPASSHMLVSKIKPCMSKYKPI